MSFLATLPILLANVAVTLGTAYWLFGRSLTMLLEREQATRQQYLGFGS